MDPAHFYAIAHWLVTMLVLIGLSGFFSASEAAFFYLRPKVLREMKRGGAAERVAAALMTNPDRVLSAVLFWNLVINVAYFTIASIAGIGLSRQEGANGTTVVVFSCASLLIIICCSEMLPKSLAVIRPRLFAALFAFPLALAVRLIDPIMPLLSTVNLLSQRLIWPSFTPEPYLDVNDLARAIELSTTDADLLDQEQRVLNNIVQLSEVRVDEMMRPRMHLRTFRPPVSLEDLEGDLPPSGYVLITEADSDELAGTVFLSELFDVPQNHLERISQPVVYVPWSATAAVALELMKKKDRDVAAVVNEFGETVGVVTHEDILDTVLAIRETRSDRLLNRRAIQPVGEGRWHITGLTSLRRLGRYFELELPETNSVTIAGVLLESLGRMPAQGDACHWGPFAFTVADVPSRGKLLVEVTLSSPADEETDG